MNLTEQQAGIIRHTLGLSGTNAAKKPWRNYYCGVKGDPELEVLVDAGFMCRGREALGGGGLYYHVTEAGAAAVGAKLPVEE